MTAHSHILPGKLHSPRLNVKTLARARLYTQIDKGLGSSVTTIVAPAGFGKTVLLTGWRTQRTAPTAWLSLDANDNHLPTFVRYLALAIETLFPDGCRETLSLVDALLPPTPAQLTDSLLSETGNLPESFALILDDYHVLANPQIHALITSLIDHVPRQLHLIIGSRSDPPLPLSRWRLGGLLSEIRGGEIRFDLIETRELLNQLLDRDVPLGVCETIAARTEGWAAGLRLAALSLQGRSDLSALSHDSLGRNRYIMDYLIDEVFSRQTPALQDLLLKSSILDWMSEPLIAALTGFGTVDAATVSPPQLLAAGLFVELINEQEGTYRYHELFRDLLRQRLASHHTAQEIAALHREASCWLASNGYIEEAVRHALAAGDRLAAARVVEDKIHALLNHEDKVRLERLLDMLPPELIAERAPLLIARAWIMHFENRLSAYPPLLARAEQLLQKPGVVPVEEERVWRGDIATMQSQLLYWQGQGQAALDRATWAAAAIPPTHDFVHGLALSYKGLSQHMVGDTTAAKRSLRESQAPGAADSTATNLHLLMALCIIHLDSLNVEQLRATSEILLRQADAAGMLISKAWGHLFLGRASYERNDLETALFHFLAGAALRRTANAAGAHDCLADLALTYAAQNLWKRADETAATLVEFDSESLAFERLAHAHSLRARLALARGDRDSAQHWLHGSDLEPSLVPVPFLEVAAVTRIQVLLALETRAGARQALDLALQLQRDAESICSALRLVQALALQALALDALEDERRALGALQPALKLAQSGGLIRTLVDLGPALGRLLSRLLKSGLIPQPGTADYVAQLLAAFPDAAGASPARHRSAMSGDLIEPLTGREVQVLELLALRQTDREIADTLVISPFTVRRHIDNISEKIGTRGRRALVERARSLELLPLRPA